MLLLKINRMYSVTTLAVLLCTAAVLLAVLTSCSMFDFRPIIITTNIDGGATVFSDRNAPVIIRFDEEPVRIDVEKALSITNTAGAVLFDLVWQEKQCVLKPVEPWIPSERYWLGINGTIAMQDGRKTQVNKKLQFYAVRNTRPPYVVSIMPESGSSITTKAGTIIELTFSEPMDTLSVEHALIFMPDFEKTFEWSNNYQKLTVCRKNDKPLIPYIRYSWKLEPFARGRDQSPLQIPVPQFFLTTAMENYQEVNKIYPASLNNGSLQLFPDKHVDDISLDGALVIEFKENIDAKTVVPGALQIEPAVSGQTVLISKKQILFIPDKILMPRSGYMLFISKTICSEEGSPMLDNYLAYFMPAIDWLKLTSVKTRKKVTQTGWPLPGNNQFTDVEYTNSDLDNYSLLKIYVYTVTVQNNPGGPGDPGDPTQTYAEFQITLQFNLPFTKASEKNNFIKYFTIRKHRDSGLVVVNDILEPYACGWVNETTVTLTYRVPETIVNDMYVLAMKGGPDGIKNSSYFMENILYYVRFELCN